MHNSTPLVPWSIEADERSAEPCLRVGQRLLRIEDMAGFRCATDVEVNVLGQAMAAGIFVAAGMLCAVPVMLERISPRLMVAAVLLIAIGLTALADVFRGDRIVVHRVYIRLRNGRTETFASPHLWECRDLADTLQEHIGCKATAPPGSAPAVI
ncbi:MAG: hypothetical protein AB7L90_12015 [Hyphomicrobiaceae bacterium]